MGKVLQIRVSAVTWNEDDVEKNWPCLHQLAFSVPIKFENHGVLEMIRGLSEGMRFMKWPQARKQALETGTQRVAALRAEMEKALADWDARKANEISDRIEDALDSLENACEESGGK